MTKNVIKNGILGGLIAATVMALMVFYMKANPEKQPNAFIGFIGMLLAFVCLITGVKQEREINGDTISFGKAFRTGLGISLIVSIIYVLAWLVIYYNFFPDFMEKYSDLVLKKAKPEDLAAKTAEMDQMKEWYKNPLMVILLTFIEIFPLGVVTSLFAALFLRKKGNSTN